MQRWTNPVYPHNFPDPQIVRTEDGWLAIATNGPGGNVQALTSQDLVSWQPAPDALPTLPSWTRPGRVWAPEIIEVDGRWVMYYTTPGPDSRLQCVSTATADRPEGPYTDVRSGPLVFESAVGGSIDASPFRDQDGSLWLLWKNDGNAVGVDTWISLQQLSADGTELVGQPRRVVKQDREWEGTLVEGPCLWRVDGSYHLFYSGNGFASPDYAVGHAVADSLTGPWTKDPEPLLVGNDVAAGPGHCSLFADGDRVWMVYHAWMPGAVGTRDPGRTMWLSQVHFDGAAVRVDEPRLENTLVPAPR
ncbi:family 43 glycosylhydrolase [Auraticoccus sp. F435]|uniref:Family 43 glycosylhydrolase n=1 Tax=Auraticoccus cholistanensis TaxID=2656650 RepID=A0A6A9UT71_9ACTN|nr:family 43 glycosylhydrolase [Auraticoccus cholistanensis]